MIETLKGTDKLLNVLHRESSFKLLESINEISTSYIDSSDSRLQAAYDFKRQQFNTEVLLDYLSADLSDVLNKKKLFITDVDIFRLQAEFVFGLSQRVGGQVAVISTHRLKTTDAEFFINRFTKEALHELGHLFKLRHCQDKLCVMNLSLNIEDIDFKKNRFCRNCKKLLERQINDY